MNNMRSMEVFLCQIYVEGEWNIMNNVLNRLKKEKGSLGMKVIVLMHKDIIIPALVQQSSLLIHFNPLSWTDHLRIN